MSDEKLLERWIDLTAHVLMQPADHDPMTEICGEISTRYCASASGTIDLCDERARLGVYRVDFDPEPYAARVGDHPLAIHFRSTGDPHTRALQDARRFCDRPWSQSLLQGLRDNGLTDFIFVPLTPVPGMVHRWLGLSAGEPLGAARDEIERLRPLIRAIDSQSRALLGCYESGGRAAAGATSTGISARELAILALLARGYTAMAIAYQLHISPRTVSKHQQNVYRKLDVQDRLSAVMRAQELGMLPPRGSRAREAASARVLESSVVSHR
jgi:DNA-binding CsgD family transcriptional regulator